MRENNSNDLKPYAISRPLSKRISWGLVVFTVGWIGFVVVFDWQLLPVLSQEIRSLIFKPVEARLVSCKIVAETNPDAGWKSVRIITYDYVVEDKTY